MSHELSGNARNVSLDVETCSEAILTPMLGHGKSPCLSRCRVLRVVGVGWRVLDSGFVDGGFFLV